MAPRRLKQERDPTRFVYVTRFGSHQCGSVLLLGGRRALGRRGPGPGVRCAQGEPQEAAVEAGVLGPRSRVPAAPASVASQPRASSARSSPGAAARAGLIQKNATKKFDFPIPLHEASKIMNKRKKVSVWNSVYKVISRMIEENENYRLRLKCQKLSGQNSN